jgi:hypothetical protein
MEQETMRTALKVAAGLGAVTALTGLASEAFAQASASTSATGSATIIQPISITKTTDLAFGTVVKGTLASTIVISSTGAPSVSAGNAVFTSTGTRSAASFLIKGEGHQAISVTVPGTFPMTGPGGSTLSVTTIPTAVTGNLSGSLGDAAAGSFTVGVGGSFPLATDTPSGAYQGSLVVSVVYN